MVGQAVVEHPDRPWPPAIPHLAPFQENMQGTCWWCGAVADSSEHRHKQTDLRRLWANGEGPVWSADGGSRTEFIRGPNSRSRAVRFGKVLCQRCNNARSQPFDLAYDKFSAHLVAHMDEWWKAPGVDLQALYGADWQQQSVHLARYYVKNFGCQMADQGIRPPASMSKFLDGTSELEDISLCLVKSESHYVGHRRYLRKLGENASLWRPADLSWVSPSQQRFTGYEGVTLVGYVGAILTWHEGWGEQDSFYPHPHPVLNVLQARPGFRLGLAKLAFDWRLDRLRRRMRQGH